MSHPDKFNPRHLCLSLQRFAFSKESAFKLDYSEDQIHKIEDTFNENLHKIEDTFNENLHKIEDKSYFWESDQVIWAGTLTDRRVEMESDELPMSSS